MALARRKSTKTKTVEQTAHLTRTADVDEVTGEVTYGDWTTGEWSNYDVPAVPGYTLIQSEVPATKVTDDTKNQTVTIDYQAVEVPTTPTTTLAARPMATLHTSGAKSMATPATHESSVICFRGTGCEGFVVATNWLR